jgi:hypothetical protein
VASADWKEIFPEFRANTKDSKDFSEKPYQVGEKWKYLDPGKNGKVDEGDPDHKDYSPQSSAYKAEMIVRFGEGVAEKKLTLEFAAKSRSVLITRETDEVFGAYGQGAAIASWQEPGRTPKFSGRVGDSGGWLKLKYESDSFRDAFKALTPRGRLLTINHGACLESSAKEVGDPPYDGRDNYGAVYMEGDAPRGVVYGGFSVKHDDYGVTAYSATKPAVHLGDLLEPYESFIDVAHCWSAHKSGEADDGSSVHETLATTIGAGNRVLGYVGMAKIAYVHVKVSAHPEPWPRSLRETVMRIVHTAIKNVVRHKENDLGLRPPSTTRGLEVTYFVDTEWFAANDLTTIYRELVPAVSGTKLQEEVNRLCELEGVGAIALKAKPVVVEIVCRQAYGEAIPGDDEQKAEKGKAATGWGNAVGKDFDVDNNPSSSRDDPKTADAKWHDTIVTP